MAQKYDLVTVPTRTDRKVKYQPWYRERLELKYLRSDQKAAALNSRRWVFVRNDMDDMRSGKPIPLESEEMVVKGREDIVPIVDSSLDILNKKGSNSTRHHIEKIIKHANGKSTTLYTKVGPRCQMQAKHVNKFVKNLQSHPLAIYPHYEESVPPELFDEIVNHLDPDMKMTGSETDCLSDTSDLDALQEDNDDLQNSETGVMDHTEESGGKTDRQMLYRLPLKKSEEEKEEEEKAERRKRNVVSASQENRVKAVTKDLCQWMSDLNPEDSSNCLEEGTINHLFTSDPESLADVLPFQVIEVANIPLSLREAFQSRNSSATSHTEYKVVDVPNLSGRSSRLVKTKYGAWYLPPKTWKLKRVDEPLRDPKVLAKEVEKNMTKTSASLDQTLGNTHGARAFKNYILTEKPGANMPYFLDGVPRPVPKQRR